MEDSRNIIKAIDALTLKAGGVAVDSKNITEAIDRLKAVYDESAIGIDKTLTKEGLAADAKAVGDAIKPVFISDIALSDTGILTGQYYITQPIVTNIGDAYCDTFIYSGYWYIRVRSRLDDSVIANTNANIRCLKLPI